MPIRHFDFYAAERKLTRTDALSHLRGLRIGVDGTTWLRRLQHLADKEPMVIAMGGMPLAFRAAVERDLTAWKNAGIQPFFVFTGIPQHRKEPPFSVEDRRPGIRAQGWEAYAQGRAGMAASTWTNVGFVAVNELQGVVFELLAKFGFEFMRAPYGSLGQLAYMDKSPRGYFHAVYANNEYLMYDVERCVTVIDFEEQTFTWVEKKRVLNSIGVNADQFLDMGLLAGCDLIGTFAPATEEGPGGFNFNNVIKVIRENGSGAFTVQAFLSHPWVQKNNYMDQLLRNRASIKHHLVLTDDGVVAPMAPDSAPSDLHLILGPRFPDSVYRMLIQGVVSAHTLNNLSTGLFLDAAPLCNGETSAYRAFLQSKELTNLRTLAVRLLAQPIGGHAKHAPVNVHYWFDPATPHALQHAAEEVPAAFWNWAVPSDIAEGKDVTLSSTLAYLSKLTTARNTLKSSAGSITAPTTINGHLFLVYSRLLELLGFVSSASHVLSPRGKTLFDAVQTLEKGAGSGSATDKLVERLMLASILMPSGCLSAKPFDQSYDLAVPADPSDRHMLLIARVASLVDARTVKAQPWTGPVSRDLLVVSSHVRTATKTLHSVCESIVMAQMIKEPASELGSTDQAVELGVRLPFVDDVNTVMGVVTHAYLAALKENAAVTPPAAVATLQASTVGEGLADIGGEIARVMSFWSAMVSVAKSSGKIDLVQQFIAADEWLQPWKAVQ